MRLIWRLITRLIGPKKLPSIKNSLGDRYLLANLWQVEANISFHWITLISIAIVIGLVISVLACLLTLINHLKSNQLTRFDEYLIYVVSIFILSGSTLAFYCTWLKEFKKLEKTFHQLQEPIFSGQGKSLFERSASRLKDELLKDYWRTYLNDSIRYIIVFITVIIYLLLMSNFDFSWLFYKFDFFQMIILGLCITLLIELPAILINYQYKKICFISERLSKNRFLSFNSK